MLRTYKSDCQPSIVGTPFGESQVLDDHPCCEKGSSEGKHGKGHHLNLMSMILSRQPATCSREVEKRSTNSQNLPSMKLGLSCVNSHGLT